MASPKFCREEAFELFVAQLPFLGETDALVRAAVAVSMHELEDANPDGVARQLDDLARRVRQRQTGVQVAAVLAHLHEVLFDEEGFAGNTADYYNPRNSYLSSVLDTRSGIPISLVLIYKAVADRLGLKVVGINAPGHFMVRVFDGEGNLLVDPFFGGRMMNREEAFEVIENVTQQPVPRDEALLRPASHEQWLARIITNLQMVFANQGRGNDVAAMSELQRALAEENDG